MASTRPKYAAAGAETGENLAKTAHSWLDDSTKDETKSVVKKLKAKFRFRTKLLLSTLDFLKKVVIN